MKRLAALTIIALGIGALVGAGLGGFLSITLGAVAAAVLPPSAAAGLVAPYACPEGTTARIDSQESQCNEHNRNSGTCKSIWVECYDAEGRHVKTLHGNTSALLLFGVCVAYCFAALGPLLFLVTFCAVLFGGGGILAALARLRERQRGDAG